MIDKILTASTGHITEQDAKFLETETEMTVANFEYGTFLFTYLSQNTPEFTEQFPEKYSKMFFNLMVHARRKDCRYICLDCDADLIDGLPHEEW